MRSMNTVFYDEFIQIRKDIRENLTEFELIKLIDYFESIVCRKVEVPFKQFGLSGNLRCFSMGEGIPWSYNNAEEIIHTLALNWNYHSGCYNYPVPSQDETWNHEEYFKKFKNCLYDRRTKYGKLRFDLTACLGGELDSIFTLKRHIG